MMRLTNLMVVVAVAGCLTAPLQLDGQTMLGVKGGVNFATLGGDDVDDADTRTGLNLGAHVDIGLSEVLGLRLGAGYSQKGTEDSEGGVDASFDLDYLEVPLLLMVKIPSEGAASAHVTAGPALAFELACELSGSGGGVSVSADCDEADVDTKPVDFGLMFGGGVSIAASPNVSILLDVAYTLGLTSIDDTSNPDDVKNRNFQITAGVAFPIGG